MYAQALRPLMIAGIGAVGTAALFAIYVVLAGNFGEFEVKVIVTTLVIGFYALTIAATFGDGKVHFVLGSIGLAAGALGLFVTVPIIWGPQRWLDNLRSIFSVALIAFAVAHIAINFRLSVNNAISGAVMVVTNVVVAIVTLMLLQLILDDFHSVSDSYMRVLMALAIADVALTIVNPIAAKLSRT